MDTNKMRANARKNYEALLKLDVASIVAQGREAAAKKDWNLAASFLATLAYPSLPVYANNRKLAWQYARNHMRYGQSFDDACHSTIKLKAVHEYVSQFINPPSWLNSNKENKDE